MERIREEWDVPPPLIAKQAEWARANMAPKAYVPQTWAELSRREWEMSKRCEGLSGPQGQRVRYDNAPDMYYYEVLPLVFGEPPMKIAVPKDRKGNPDRQFLMQHR